MGKKIIIAAACFACLIVCSACTGGISADERDAAGLSERQSVLTDVYPLSRSVFRDVYDSRVLSPSASDDHMKAPLKDSK